MLVQSGFDPTTDAFALLDLAADAIVAVRDNLGLGVPKAANSYMDQWEADLLKRSDELVAAKSKGKTVVLGLPTALKAMDVITQGYLPGLYVFGARPGMGKTIYGCCLLLELAAAGVKTLYFSLEMDKSQLISRIVANMTGIDGGKIRTGNLTATEKKAISEAIRDPLWENIIIDDEAGQTEAAIKSKMRQAVRKQGVGAFILDYLGLVEFSDIRSKLTTTEKITNILKALRNTARKLLVPMIGFVQLSRDVEKTALKMPEIHHLSESKGYEEHSDFVAFLYRPAHYWSYPLIRKHFQEIESGRYQQSLFILVAKNRHGINGVTIPACVDLAKSKIMDIVQMDWLEQIGTDAAWIYKSPEVMQYIGIDGGRQMSIDEFDSNRGTKATKGGNESTFVVEADNSNEVNYDFPF
jgi:replicative DNA helicase